MVAVKKSGGKSTPTTLSEIGSSGRTFFRPSTTTPQQLGLKGPEQIKTEGEKAAADAAAKQKKQKPALSALDRYTQMIQGMLTGGTYKKPYEDLMGSLNTMYGGADGTGGAKGTVNTAMDELSTFLKGQANPYSGFQAQTAQTTPELSKFLSSQAVPTTPLEQYAATINAQNTGAGTAFQNLGNMLGNIYGANMTGQLGDVEQQRASLANQLEQQRLGYGAQINEKITGRQDEMLKLLMNSILKGGKPKSGKLM